jgi:hypothetical protein
MADSANSDFRLRITHPSGVGYITRRKGDVTMHGAVPNTVSIGNGLETKWRLEDVGSGAEAVKMLDSELDQSYAKDDPHRPKVEEIDWAKLDKERLAKKKSEVKAAEDRQKADDAALAVGRAPLGAKLTPQEVIAANNKAIQEQADLQAKRTAEALAQQPARLPEGEDDKRVEERRAEARAAERKPPA